MLTKKHYQATAEILKQCGDEIEHHRMTKRFADYFAADNSRFDRQWFYTACGLEYNGQ